MKKLLLHWRLALLLVFYPIMHVLAPTVIAQTTGTFDITLQELGYDEKQLVGPISTVQYDFSLPPNWQPQNGSYVEFDLDYIVNIQDQKYPPALLEVRLNGRLLHTERLSASSLLKLRVYMPSDGLLLAEDKSTNDVQLKFIVDEECRRAQLTLLTVKATSLLHLAYEKRSPRLDLSLYPKPLYQQRAFEPAQVRFVLPSEMDSAGMRAATMISARLGRLTSAQVPISATLSSDFVTGTTQKEHLIIVGRPDDNPLIQKLALPVPLAERRLALTSQMPAVVKPGDTISYTLTVENTSAVTQSLAVEDRLPVEGQLLTCTGQWGRCIELKPGVVRWSIGSLTPGRQVSTTVSMNLDKAILPGAVIEHTASLFDRQGLVVNVDTLSAQVGEATSEQLIATKDKLSNYFFIHNNQGVAEGDGLVQEIISPWSSDHVAIVVTGLDEKALLRAAQALSTDARFPGMWGNYAIIQAAHAVSDSIALPSEDVSFLSLGYTNWSINGLHREYFEYYFDIPQGWKLSNNAYLALHISHGMVLTGTRTVLEFELNDLPVGSAPLDKSNAHDSWITLPLPANASQIGGNSIRIRASVDIDDVCRYITSDQYWLTIYSDSFLHLPRQETELRLDLNGLPYPFSNHPELEDVVFLLPERPGLTEIEGVLRFAHRMGSAAEGGTLWPHVVLGGQPDTNPWSDYHLIAVGLPTSNHYLAAANDNLPQPFRPGTNEILQEVDRVVYRLPPDVSLGYVQELPSPWDKKRAMLAVTGTTDEGIAWALTSLTDDQLRWRLSGNLALIRARKVWSMDTRKTKPEAVVAITQRVGLSLIPGATPTVTPTITPSPSPTVTLTVPATLTPTMAPTLTPTFAPTIAETSPPVAISKRPVWLVPLLVLSVLITVALIIIAAWKARS